MSKRADLAKVTALTQLVLDHRLHQLREAAAARDRSQMQLGAITAAAAPADLSPVTAGLVGLAYQRWADIRRSELNAVIARQTATWIEARSDARTAFGRVQAITGVAEKLPRK
jgi:hypothetical protein